MATIPRPDLKPHDQAMRLPLTSLVGALTDALGARLVAYIGSVKETRAVHQWSAGTRKPDAETQRRLRESYTVAAMLLLADPPAVVQAWFQGLNPLLDDRSPARLLREGELDEIGPQVLAAARAFLAQG